MSTQRINLPTDTPLFTIGVSFSDRVFTLRFDYQERSDRWYLSIYDVNGAPIRRGMKCVTNWNVLLQDSSAAAPAGNIFFADLTDLDDGESAGFHDLGRRVTLVYDDRFATVTT